MTKSAVSADLVVCTEEIHNGKLHFLCNVEDVRVERELFFVYPEADLGLPLISLTYITH